MRHVHGQAHRVLAGLAEPQLHQGRRAARHVNGAEPPGMPLDELGPGGVRRHAHRASVRDRQRDGVQPDGQLHPEQLGELVHSTREALPLHVRLGAAQQQERRAVGVADQVQRQLGRLVAGPPVAVEPHRRPARPVVEQLVDVELGDRLGVELGEQCVDREPSPIAGIDEALQPQDQHRCARLGRIALHSVEIGRIEHVSHLHRFVPTSATTSPGSSIVPHSEPEWCAIGYSTCSDACSDACSGSEARRDQNRTHSLSCPRPASKVSPAPAGAT